jgi:rhodanese-related sulfurtransferase
MPTPLDLSELQPLLTEQQAQLVEVLPAAEYEEEHLPGAINIPLNNSPSRRPGNSSVGGRWSSTASTTSET